MHVLKKDICGFQASVLFVIVLFSYLENGESFLKVFTIPMFVSDDESSLGGIQ